LQHPSARRIYAVENINNGSSSDLKTNYSMISIEEESNTQQNLPATTPVKHLTSRKIHSGPIEVRILFLNIELFI